MENSIQRKRRIDISLLNHLLWEWEQELSMMVLKAELVVLLELQLDRNCFQQGMTYPDVVHEDSQNSTLAN